MTAVEKSLHEHFANMDDTEDSSLPSSSTPLSTLPDYQPEPLEPPFAKVNTVAANSPAEAAGLRPGDEIRKFGYVDLANNDGLRKVAECVQGNEDVSYNS